MIRKPKSLIRVDEPLEYYIDEILKYGKWSEYRIYPAKYERLSYWLCTNIIKSGNVGLLSLCIGTANWGVSLVPPDITYKDPVGQGWKGVGSRNGKHLLDHRKGGFGVVHYDSHNLEHFYSKYGYPDIPNDWKDMKFDEMRNIGGSSWNNWQKWALKLLQNRSVQHHIFERWLEKTWEKSLDESQGDIRKAIVNSRIRNSGGGLANRLAHLDVDTQLYEYGSKNKRRERQANYIKRVLFLYDKLRDKHPSEMFMDMW